MFEVRRNTVKARNSITRVSFSLVVLVGLLALLVGTQPALAQTRPGVGIPDNTGPDTAGDQSGNQQSGRFINLTRGLSSLGNIDLPDVCSGDLTTNCQVDANCSAVGGVCIGNPSCVGTPDPDPCDQNRRHFSVRVPLGLTEWTLWIFDGDSRQGPGGGALKWDNCASSSGSPSPCAFNMNEVKYTVYADPSGPISGDSVFPDFQALPANIDPADVIPVCSETTTLTCSADTDCPIGETCGAVLLGEKMPEDKWTGFTFSQDPGDAACGKRGSGGGAVHNVCGYHVVAEWIPDLTPSGSGPTGLFLEEQANFKMGVSGLDTDIFVYDKSNLGYIGYNGHGQSFNTPGGTTYDGTFTFTIPVDLPQIPLPSLLTILVEGDFDVGNDTDDLNFFGTDPGFPSVNADPEGTLPGSPADDPDPQDIFLTWPGNVSYELTAPGGLWTASSSTFVDDNCSLTTSQSCAINADCPATEICGLHCTTPDTCSIDDDCPGTEICSAGFCSVTAPQPCLVDTDCPGTETCGLLDNPSGDTEWENFTVGTPPFAPPVVDATVDSIPNGDYTLQIANLDARNTIFISFQLPAAGDPDPNC